MQTIWSQPKGDTQPAARAELVARALSILYNNSRVYGIEHPVFRKTLEEHMPSIQNALAEAGELAFTFLNGKLHCGSLLLNPSSTVFQSLAHTLEGIGVSGFTIMRGVTAEEFSKLIAILTSQATWLAKRGLQSMLDLEKIEHIRETKPTFDLSGKPKTAAPSDMKKKSTKEPSAPSAAGKTFVLHDTIDDLGSEPAEQQVGQTTGPTGRDSKTSGPFKEFVTSALTDFAWKRADIHQVAHRISTEFEERLTAATETLRQEKETTVRRLESVKNVVFAKLEAMDIIAILVDTDLRVLNMTSAARALIGNISGIPVNSPLADCVKHQAAHMNITLAGKPVTVQTIASDNTHSGETILLLTLNPG